MKVKPETAVAVIDSRKTILGIGEDADRQRLEFRTHDGFQRTDAPDKSGAVEVILVMATQAAFSGASVRWKPSWVLNSSLWRSASSPIPRIVLRLSITATAVSGFTFTPKEETYIPPPSFDELGGFAFRGGGDLTFGGGSEGLTEVVVCKQVRHAMGHPKLLK